MSATETTGAVPRRRRVRVATATVRRVKHQQAHFAEQYADTTTAIERFVVLVRALRAALAPGAHQVDDTESALERINALLAGELDRLHTNQLTAAQHVLDRETARQHRKEGGNGNDHLAGTAA